MCWSPSAFLLGEGYVVVSAADGDTALRQVRKRSENRCSDADFAMPGLSGVRVDRPGDTDASGPQGADDHRYQGLTDWRNCLSYQGAHEAVPSRFPARAGEGSGKRGVAGATGGGDGRRRGGGRSRLFFALALTTLGRAATLCVLAGWFVRWVGTGRRSAGRATGLLTTR